MILARLAPTALAVAFALVLAACATTSAPDAAIAEAHAIESADAPADALRDMPATPVVPTPVAVVPPPHDNLNAVAWVQTSMEYRLLAKQAWRSGEAQLARALASPDWDALVPSERANPPTGLPPAVIVDIDETVLDNSPYQARLVRDGGHYDETTRDAWGHERRGAAGPGPGADAPA